MTIFAVMRCIVMYCLTGGGHNLFIYLHIDYFMCTHFILIINTRSCNVCIFSMSRFKV